MKVDGLGVILAIILLPIILVVTYYIQLQVDTIAKQNQYNENLLNATYDAMSAFEINTANEELSGVADSMRSIILASNNIFFNTLATNLGISNASKEYVRPYIPAILYTMYDGYYIYSPTEKAEVAEKTKESTGSELITTQGYLSVGDEGVTYMSGNHYKYNPESTTTSFKDATYSDYGSILYKVDGQSYYTTDKNEATKNTDYVLKSYVQYSARYKRGNKDFTINYTLDNYLNIAGKIGDTYYTKTGYLIEDGIVQNANIDGPFDLTKNNENNAKNKILGKKTNVPHTTQDAANNLSVTVDGITITANWQNIKNALINMGYYQEAHLTGTGYPNIRTISEAEVYLQKAHEEGKDLAQIQNLEYEIQNYQAIAYYVSSVCFSNWVYANLGDLTYGDLQDDSMTDYYISAGYESTSGIGADDFYYNFKSDSVKDRAIFLKTENPEDAESNFNTHKMEVIKNSIKYNLNLSISAYCQMSGIYDFGLPILLDEEWDKILQNISIVSFMQGLDCGLEIYNNYQIVSSTNNELAVSPNEIYYLKKDEFNDGESYYHRIDCPYLTENSDNDMYISFKSKEVKYDKIYDKATDKYKYDHRNLACYTCINTNNYTPIAADSIAKKRARYIGIASKRQEIYKMNALPVSEGYKIYNIQKTADTGNVSVPLSVDLKDVTKLQITFSNTKSINILGNKEPILNLSTNINIGGVPYSFSLNLDQSKEQTVTLDVSNVQESITSIELKKETPNYDTSYVVESVKVIYR